MEAATERERERALTLLDQRRLDEVVSLLSGERFGKPYASTSALRFVAVPDTCYPTFNRRAFKERESGGERE